MVKRILSDNGVQRAELSISFVGRRLIRRLNREYLGRDRVTDVIAFDLSAGDDGLLVGDIYSCVLRAREQAARYGVSPEEELFRLAAHGTLHVLGCDHAGGDERREMFELQERAVRENFEPRLEGRIEPSADGSGPQSTNPGR